MAAEQDDNQNVTNATIYLKLEHIEEKIDDLSTDLEKCHGDKEPRIRDLEAHKNRSPWQKRTGEIGAALVAIVTAFVMDR